MGSAGVRVRNPAFDVTPHRLVTGLITEEGVFVPGTKKFLRWIDDLKKKRKLI